MGAEPAGPCREAVLDACAAAGFSPDVVVDSEDYPTALAFVAAGLGVALLPRIALGDAGTQVAVREVRDPRPVRSIQVAVRDAGPLPGPVRALVAALRTAAQADSAR